MDGETEVCSSGPGHVPKMAAIPLYGKNLFKSLLLRTQKDRETCYAASGARVQLTMCK